MRRFLVVTSLMTVITAVTAVSEAQEGSGDGFSALRPAVNVNFTSGTTEKHNSVGLTLGGHTALFRLGRLRFPMVGVDMGFASKCDPEFTGNPSDWMDDGCRMVGLVQLAGGAEFTISRFFRDSGWRGPQIAQEMSLYVAITYPIVGQLKGERGMNFGFAIRWNKLAY
jgi:hypothetical protein